MAITPIEIVVIAVVLIVFVMWGPKKIPELARSLGLAKKEFQAVQAEVSGNPQVRPQSPGDSLIETARKLGISTGGKTAERISEEIVKKVQSGGETNH